jgi:hypothetical protein
LMPDEPGNYNFSYVYYTDWRICVCDPSHISPKSFSLG